MAGRKKPTGTALANVDEELNKEVAQIQNRIGAPETNSISIRDKIFTFPDGRVEQGPLELVIVDFLAWNQYFDRPFDAKNPAPPVCFAYGREVRNLVPSENAPERQAEACESCWANEFGSGNGDGKACKNQRRLVVMDPHEDPESGPLYTLNVPPASLKKFDGYVSTIQRVYQAPPIKVVTSVSFHPESVYAQLIFHNPQPNPNYREHFARREEARLLLEAEPDLSGYEPAKPKRSARSTGRKRAAK